MIIRCARFDRRTLSRLSRVCREWFSEVAPILWLHAHGDEEGLGMLWSGGLQVTGARMLDTLINLGKLVCLHIDIVGGTVVLS
jgi:hypothetical protein